MEQKDLDQIKAIGITADQVNTQIENFKTGFPFAKLVKAATIGDGIAQFSDTEIKHLVDLYDQKAPEKDVIKFVPASGAASRMFKGLFNFADSPEVEGSMADAMSNIQDFAFGAKVLQSANSGEDQLATLQSRAKFILEDVGLNYGHLPKGIILFHNYPEGPRTAFEEHLVEGAAYARADNGVVRIHFTVSPEHQPLIQAHLKEVIADYERKFGVEYEISFSTQDKATDTIAVDLDNEPFRNEDGSVLFRPAGHGALIQNLNNIAADIVFVKNIDNVVPDRLKGDTYTFKKALGGYLIQLEEQVHELLTALDADQSGVLAAAESFCNEKLGLQVPNENKLEFIKSKLNRPIRICGMVKNEGEPGGGPFWVEGSDSTTSLQIIESSQIDMDNAGQKEILDKASHFNPVDLICGTKDYKGESFDLRNFVDPSTGFVSQKSKDGRELKAQELPGLWNGAMADWMTFFVEVPVITFNPVKTVLDLLRDEHRG